MKKKLIFLFFFILFLNSFSQNKTSMLYQKADEQRLLSEIMSKNFLLIGAQINVTDSKSELKESIQTFDENLEEILNFLKMDDTKLFKPEVKDFWDNFKEKIQEKNSQKNASEIMTLSNELSISCLELAKYIKTDSDYKVNSIQNLLNKQLLNSQKIIKFCTAAYWKVENTNLEKDLKESIISFEFSLDRLLKETEKNVYLHKEIEIQAEKWMCDKEKIEVDFKDLDLNEICSDFNKTFSGFRILLENIEVDKKQIVITD
jgi:ribonuclease HI